GLNYKDVNDPAVVVSFPLRNMNGAQMEKFGSETSLLAWTTTPWTLPSNLALCVNKSFVYVKIKDLESNNIWILCKNRLVELYPLKKKQKKGVKDDRYEILDEFTGEALVGLQYVPLFPYFEEEMKSAFRVVCDDYVT